MLRARSLATLALAAGLLFATAPPAAAATPVYSGTGWKILTGEGIYSLHPDPYEIVWADTTARSKLKPYMAKPSSQVSTVTGVQIRVTDTIDLTPATSCPPRHRIVVHYTYRPMGLKGMSQARPCYAIADGSAWGGHVLMDSEYWTTASWFSTDPVKNESYRKNATSHEILHILGLDHPNYDRDGDGTIEAAECVTTSTGTRPLMCSPNGGYYNSTDAGKGTLSFEEPGLRQLIANWHLRNG
ncbi:hypothetical protein OG342_06960 [Streptomyces bobili]|uniref:hypothetical protein n=1 Tax=Streptomyces bobili TaxID=67280 RepID=UPI0022592ECA|nr:hypothetical protein [Streptomyces bobili]MCX5522603.1 hypothetical protein [Streptomyces bobili]